MRKLISFTFLCFIYFINLNANLYSQTARFAIIADYGLDHTYNISPYLQDSGDYKVSELVKGWQTDTNYFIITVGDNNYPNGELDGMDNNIGKFYHAYIRPRITGLHSYSGGPGPNVNHNRFFPAMGNHEFYNHIGGGGDPCNTLGCPYYMYFPISVFKNAGPGEERYYDYLQGNIRFFVINSGLGDSYCPTCEPDGLDSNSNQAIWLRNGLDTSTARWNIVYFHHPPYFSSDLNVLDELSMFRWPFKRWGADIVFNAHDHNYERINIDDFTYIINGLGGVRVVGDTVNHSPRPGSNVLLNGEVGYVAKYGAILAESYSDSIVFKFININNQVIDKYRLPTAALKLNILIEGFYNSSLDTLNRDTVRAYLRNSTSPYAIVEQSKGYLDTAGSAIFDFPNSANSTNYYLVVKHRNSIETWSANTISFNSYYKTYNFTTANSQAYGNNMVQKGSKWCIISGDVNQDNIIDAADISLVDGDATNSLTGYVSTDVTGDKIVDGSDITIVDNNSNNNISVISP